MVQFNCGTCCDLTVAPAVTISCHSITWSSIPSMFTKWVVSSIRWQSSPTIPPLAPLSTSDPKIEHHDAEPWYVERAMLTEYVMLWMDTSVSCPTVAAFLMEYLTPLTSMSALAAIMQRTSNAGSPDPLGGFQCWWHCFGVVSFEILWLKGLSVSR